MRVQLFELFLCTHPSMHFLLRVSLPDPIYYNSVGTENKRESQKVYSYTTKQHET